MVTTHSLDHFDPSIPDLLKELRLQADSSDARDVHDLVAESRKVARPRGVSRVVQIEGRSAESITAGREVLRSRVLQVNTQNTQRIFVFAATCGSELAEWAQAHEDPVHHFTALSIAEKALKAMVKTVEQDLQNTFDTGPLSCMLPGSLQDWPIQEQDIIFRLLGEGPRNIGLRLTDSKLMIPAHSVAGLLYASAEDFVSCQLCPLSGCTHRKRVYDPTLLREKYGLDADCRKTSV